MNNDASANSWPLWIVAIGLTTFLIGCDSADGAGANSGSGSGNSGKKSEIHRVETGFLQQEHISRKLRTFGSLEAKEEIQLSPQVTGRIVRIQVDEGDTVEEGDLLLRLDGAADEIALKRTRAELEKASQELKKLQSGSRPEEIEEARTRLTAAQVSTEAARDDWERVDALAKQGIASTSDRVKARSNYDVSQALLSQAQARFELVSRGFREEDIRVAQAEVAAREAQVDEILRRLKEHEVRAPASGVIANRLKEGGEWISGGEAALVLLVLDPMRLRVEAPQSYIAQIRPGLEASVSVPGLPEDSFQAGVLSIIPQANPGTRNFPVILELDNPELRLAAGMYAQVELETDFGQDALVAPREAVQYREQNLVVYRVDDTSAPPSPGDYDEPILQSTSGTLKVTEIQVRITQELDQSVVIESEPPGQLKDGDELVTMGGTRLKTGDTVERLSRSSQ